MTSLDYRGAGAPQRHSVVTVGLYVFLIALAMLFGATMLGYVYIRLVGPLAKGSARVHVPALLWVSTGLVLGVSVVMHLAVDAVRGERLAELRGRLRIAMALACGFVAVQAPAMVMLLRQHAVARASGVNVYGLIFFMVLLHALHVVGGIVALARVMYHESRGRYDHEHYLPVKHATIYWHFLDVVWVVMFATFLVVG